MFRVGEPVILVSHVAKVNLLSGAGEAWNQSVYVQAFHRTSFGKGERTLYS